MNDQQIPGQNKKDDQAGSIWEELPVWLILGATWAFSIWAFSRLPARAPIHFNLSGQADRWGSTIQGAFLPPALATGVCLLILALEMGGAEFLASHEVPPRVFRLMRLLIVTLISSVHLMTLASTLGLGISPIKAIPVLLGAFSLILGYIMPNLEPNAWIGVRLRVTLEDRRVWKGTHQLAGRIWIIGGLVQMGLFFAPTSLQMPLLMVTFLPLIVVPIIVAYHLRATLPPQA